MATRSEVTVLRIPVHPGEILKEELKERKIKQKDFAKEIGMQPSHLNEILHGKRDINNDIALKLEEALGIDAGDWLRGMLLYERDVKAKRERDAHGKEHRVLSSLSSVMDVTSLCNRLGIAAGSIADRFKALTEMFPPVSPSK